MSVFDDTRIDWQARPAKAALTFVPAARRTEFFSHYDGGTPIVVNTHADCLARVKHDQTFHMDSNGWSDIGYNGLVCQHGRAIEGRGIDYAGAHCPDHNTPGYGFQFMVGGPQDPTPAAYARMARLYADCSTRSGRALAKKGHRDGFATACPGDHIYAWVRAGMKAPSGSAAGTSSKPTTTPAAPVVKDDFDMTPDERKQFIDDLATAVVNKPVPRPGNYPVPLGVQVGGANVGAYRVLQFLKAQDQSKLVAAVTAAVQAAQPDVDVDALAKAIVIELGKDDA